MNNVQCTIYRGDGGELRLGGGDYGRETSYQGSGISGMGLPENGLVLYFSGWNGRKELLMT